MSILFTLDVDDTLCLHDPRRATKTLRLKFFPSHTTFVTPLETKRYVKEGSLSSFVVGKAGRLGMLPLAKLGSTDPDVVIALRRRLERCIDSKKQEWCGISVAASGGTSGSVELGGSMPGNGGLVNMPMGLDRRESSSLVRRESNMSVNSDSSMDHYNSTGAQWTPPGDSRAISPDQPTQIQLQTTQQFGTDGQKSYRSPSLQYPQQQQQQQQLSFSPGGQFSHRFGSS